MFEFDFSQVNSSYMHTYQITEAEVISVFSSKFSVVKHYTNRKFRLLIGYSIKRKMLTIMFDTESVFAEIRILDVTISYEEEIRKFYCGKN